jgi:hypothetical protein
MKKILLFVFSFVLFISCERDESLDPRPIFIDGNFVRLDITTKLLNFDDPNVFFGGMLTAPRNQVSKYNLYVRKTDLQGASLGDFKLLKTVTSFPLDLRISIADIAQALGVDESSILNNETFRFYGESFDLAGNRADFSNLSTAIRSNLASYKPAYRFNTAIRDNEFLIIPGNIPEYDNYLPQ